MRYVKTFLAIIHAYPIETALIGIAVFISILSFVPWNQTQPEPMVQGTTASKPSPTPSRKKSIPDIYVEVSGAVFTPNVYKVAAGTHLKDVLDMAGGLTAQADKLYVARNYNMAKLVGDQEKIYIPYTWDIYNGTFREQKRILEYLQPLYQSPSADSTSSGHGTEQATDANSDGSGLQISINSATAQELDTLSGVGPVTAQKIVDSRPYSSIDELLSKKVVNSSTFEKIKDLVKL